MQDDLKKSSGSLWKRSDKACRLTWFFLRNLILKSLKIEEAVSKLIFFCVWRRPKRRPSKAEVFRLRILRFFASDKIILEIKYAEAIANEHIKQTLNYLSVSKLKLGLIVNFGEKSLVHKRVLM